MPRFSPSIPLCSSSSTSRWTRAGKTGNGRLRCGHTGISRHYPSKNIQALSTQKYPGTIHPKYFLTPGGLVNLVAGNQHFKWQIYRTDHLVRERCSDCTSERDGDVYEIDDDDVVEVLILDPTGLFQHSRLSQHPRKPFPENKKFKLEQSTVSQIINLKT